MTTSPMLPLEHEASEAEKLAAMKTADDLAAAAAGTRDGLTAMTRLQSRRGAGGELVDVHLMQAKAQLEAAAEPLERAQRALAVAKDR